MKSILLTIISFISVHYFDEDNQSRQGNGLSLINKTFSNCDNSTDSYKMINRITSKRVSDDTLYLSISFIDNCGYGNSWEPIISFHNDSLYIRQNHIIRILEDGSEDPGADCNCCFGVDLVINGISESSFITLFNDSVIYLTDEKYRTVPEKFIIHQGDTINRVNKYGLQNGIWKAFDSSGNVVAEIKYKYKNMWFSDQEYLKKYLNGRLIWKIFGWDDSTHYYNIKGDVVFREYKNGKKMESEFYKNGTLKFIYPKNSKDSCLYFDEEGDQILKPND